MKFTPEQLAKAKAANSAEELLALAKENGIEMTEDEANKYFADFHKEGELSDEELDNVSGGCGDDYPERDPDWRACDEMVRLVGICGSCPFFHDGYCKR